MTKKVNSPPETGCSEITNAGKTIRVEGFVLLRDAVESFLKALRKQVEAAQDEAA